MRRLIWSARARDDLFEIVQFYARIDPALAFDMLERIELAPMPLLSSPGIGSLTSSGARKWVAPKTPFLLFYDTTDDAVEVVAVRHVRSSYPR